MHSEQSSKQRSRKNLSVPVTLLLVAAVLFSSLGIWQVKRLAWKQDLIARVEQRVHAQPVAIPASWSMTGEDMKDHEYQRVMLDGEYVPSGTALVRAVTTLGTGYWVLTPMKLNDGRSVYINRGYVPVGSKIGEERAATPQGKQHVVGLLRLNEEGGGFLRSNDPAGGNWYSRDVALMAKTYGIGNVAPFFVDARSEEALAMDDDGQLRSALSGDAAHDRIEQAAKKRAERAAEERAAAGLSSVARQDAPVPGLTVISFPNSHLSYAITWFSMAILSIGLALWLRRKRNSL